MQVSKIKANLRQLKDINERVSVLNALKKQIENHTDEILAALKNDLGKSSFESFLGEIDFVQHEIKVAINKVRKWSRPKCVSSPLAFAPARSFIVSEAYGVVLVIGPWNYPFQLILAPLIGAIAAGNCVVVKPSEISSKTALIIEKILNHPLLSKYIECVNGGIEETTALLNQRFDYIFYTGNGHVGRIVMNSAAKFLTPTTLELGGKSPCLVYSKNLDISAKRIMWGKYFNVGQTCVAPDYIIMKKSDVEEFVSHCKKWLECFYGKEIVKTNDYGRIINKRHFERLESYLEGQKVIYTQGRNIDELFFSPTIIEASEGSKVMTEEIFGPILPILTIETLEEGIEYVNKNDKPLACYGFLDTSEQKNKLVENVSSGGMVINDTLVHLSNENLPFGGVGESGMGAYHGKFSFDLFSHKKAVMKRSFLFENSLRYPPYEKKVSFIRKIMKLIS